MTNSHEKLEHFYRKFEQNNKYHCYENKDADGNINTKL